MSGWVLLGESVCGWEWRWRYGSGQMVGSCECHSFARGGFGLLPVPAISEDEWGKFCYTAQGPSRLGGQVFRRVPILVALKIIFSPDMTLKADPFSSKWVGFYIRMQTWWVGKNTREPFDALDPWWRRRGGSNLRGEWMVMGYNFSPPAQGLAHSVGIEGAWTEYSQ